MEMEKKYDNFHYIAKISREDRRPDGSKYYVQTAIEDEAEILDPIFSQDNTLVYICGIKGMESGIYKGLAKKRYPEYLLVKGDYVDMDPDEWDWEDMRRKVKPGARCFEEVY
jgi:ferredoxin--NADP+ reductase